MNPQEQIKELQNRIGALEAQFKQLSSNATIPLLVAEAFKARLIIKPLDTMVRVSPQAAITAPSGGATVDSEARTAVNAVITALETAGLVTPN